MFYVSDLTNININIFKYEISNVITAELYNNLEKLNKNFESFSYEVDNNHPSDMPTPRREITKIKIDGVPALDYRIGGAGSYGRSIYILRNNYVIDIFHNAPYLNLSESQKVSGGYKDFEKFIESVKFIK